MIISFLHTKKAIAVFVLACLLAVNYPIVAAGLDNNFFGILFSIALFLIAGRPTSLKLSYPLLVLILGLEFISFRLHTKTLHFQALLLLACLLYYGFTGKFSFIAFICLFLFSSIFDQLFNYLTVEIKQGLCYSVFVTLRNFIPINKIEGVNFYINNSKISIDTACMGLSMFKTGLLSGAFLLTLEERKQQKYYSILQILLFCCLLVLLNIISNYFRIITLILFKCTEENFLHHTIGILCFVFYQIIPMLFLIRFFKPKINKISSIAFYPKLIPVITIIAIIFITSFEIKKEQNHSILENLNPKYNVQKGSWVNKEVFKIATPEELVYIKTPIHKPLICWTGNGYKIVESRKITKNKEEIWFVKMEKNNIEYYSYWWYECGNKKYTSLVEVLLIKLFYNKSVRLINETSRA
ncbi:exosortase N [Flavobacterium sp. GA093]|uniref:Exosortase N n=1 Tax=Flavobacterium hydrocarbonoxydans TaxID=2683249 RepID=A0A6I4NRE6_9FLAO|nr:exosortase N [Flavobacterium hydrocarbonoxydans]MWB95055.1 exosortase N [Flavobacterium hydrocarbonoxydans]